MIETGFLSSVTKHPDGRITLIRATPGEMAMFLHIQLTPREEDALRRVLDKQASPCYAGGKDAAPTA